jgi:hypothetical protein
MFRKIKEIVVEAIESRKGFRAYQKLAAETDKKEKSGPVLDVDAPLYVTEMLHAGLDMGMPTESARDFAAAGLRALILASGSKPTTRKELEKLMDDIAVRGAAMHNKRVIEFVQGLLDAAPPERLVSDEEAKLRDFLSRSSKEDQ